MAWWALNRLRRIPVLCRPSAHVNISHTTSSASLQCHCGHEFRRVGVVPNYISCLAAYRPMSHPKILSSPNSTQSDLHTLRLEKVLSLMTIGRFPFFVCIYIYMYIEGFQITPGTSELQQHLPCITCVTSRTGPEPHVGLRLPKP